MFRRLEPLPYVSCWNYNGLDGLKTGHDANRKRLELDRVRRLTIESGVDKLCLLLAGGVLYYFCHIGLEVAVCQLEYKARAPNKDFAAYDGMPKKHDIAPSRLLLAQSRLTGPFREKIETWRKTNV